MILADISKFQRAVLEWYDAHGRKDLPWQKNATPYQVWVSEIMLQQTQVKTVIPYFERFIQRFSDVQSLAKANLDEVLHLWSGLGYYARARHLHKTASIIHEKWNGKFPTSIHELADLPGIGLSTAGAILSFGMKLPASILDGNIKRVLTRVYAIGEYPQHPKTTKALWQIAENLTPQIPNQTVHYNQAMMDLGAMICRSKNPECTACPLSFCCKAHQEQNVAAYPAGKPTQTIQKRKSYFLILQNVNREILLIKRPPIGIWGGLWSLPESPTLKALSQWSEHTLGYQLKNTQELSSIQHVFTHFKLTMIPIKATIKSLLNKTMENHTHIWYKKEENHLIGLPAPIQRILKENCI